MRKVGDIPIYHWSEIKDDFREADIFLGNGFSININASLNYRSLFDHFLKTLKPDEQVVFKSFSTTNFESILTKLSDASEVNRIFNYETGKITEAVQGLKSGLVHAVENLHPSYSMIDPQVIHSLSKDLDWFRHIYTSNYDTFLYHILLSTVDRSRRDVSVRKIQDFFRPEGDNLVFSELASLNCRNLYYLHGALFLFCEEGKTFKLKRGAESNDLLDLTRLKIRLGNLPLFVSEGKSADKERVIFNNQYLAFCRDSFLRNTNKMVIYGFSFSNADDHLTNLLNFCKRHLAVGIYLSGLTESKTLRKLKFVQEKLYRYSPKDLRFFDSQSLF